MARSEALPVDEDGRTYITDAMLREDDSLSDFLTRTINSWEYDQLRRCYYAYPSIRSVKYDRH